MQLYTHYPIHYLNLLIMRFRYFFSICTSLFLVLYFTSCSSSDKKNDEFSLFKAFYQAEINMDDSKWDYTTDTLRVWYGKTDAEPTLKYKGAPKDPWIDWNVALNAKSSYDTIWYAPEEHAIKGFFYENNDFYNLLGASANKTLRTYTFNTSLKITDVRYENIPEENTLSGKHMAPVYTWAQTYAPEEIAAIFPNNQLVPSTENALRWKKLLEQYRAQTGK